MKLVMYWIYDFFFPIWFGVAPEPATVNIFNPPRRFCLIVWPLRVWRNILIGWLTGRLWFRRAGIAFLAHFFPTILIESVVDETMMQSECVWKDGRYSIGVDVDQAGDACAVLIYIHRDGTIEVLGDKRWSAGLHSTEGR